MGYYAGGMGGVMDVVNDIPGYVRYNVERLAATASRLPGLNAVPYPVLVAAAWAGAVYVGYRGLKVLRVLQPVARVGIMSGAFNPGAFGSGGFGGGWGAAGGGNGVPNSKNEGNPATANLARQQEEALKAELRKMSTMDLFKAVASAQAGTALYSAIRSVLVWRLAKYVAIVAAVAGVSYGGYYWYKNGRRGNGKKRKKHAAADVSVEDA